MQRLIILFTIFLLGICFEQAKANHDTLYICDVGDTIRLRTSPNYAAYAWSPSSTLDNPTIYNPIASPTRTTTYIARAISASGNNLIINSDFSQGNLGFTSKYRYEPVAITSQGTYGVTNNPARLNASAFAACGDRTTGTGNMLMVDGSPQAREEVWCQKVKVEANKNYAFSTWLASVNVQNPAALQFSINGDQLGEIFNATNRLCDWRQFYATWESGMATEANICIVNQNINRAGNDFALDDFAFFELAEVRYDTVTVVVVGQKVTVIDTSLCDGNFITYQNKQIFPNSRERFTLNTTLGCDSLVIWNVGLLDTIFESLRIDTLCPGEILSFFGENITRDTTICRTFAISNSCDSTYCVTVVFLTETALATASQSPSCFEAADGKLAIEPMAGLQPYRFAWNTGDSIASLENLRAGVYQITVTDTKGCTTQKAIYLEEPPQLMPQLNAASRWCNDKVWGQIFLNAIGGTPPYRYSLDAGTTLQQQQVVQPLDVGLYNLLIQDANNCSITAPIGIAAPERAEIVLLAPNGIELGDSVQVEILDNAPSPLSYAWEPADGIACTNCPTTIVVPLRTTNYTITGTDTLGCQWQTNWRVEVNKNASLFIPDIFSPNGDKVNDKFQPFSGKGITAIETIQIFDRWGSLVFEGNACTTNPSACVWDGYFKGSLQVQGTYTYFVVLRYLDDTEALVKGSVFLAR